MTVLLDEVFAELSESLGATTIGDPYPLFAERRRTAPVMEGDLMAEFGLPAMAQSVDGSRKMFTLFRYDDIVAALRNHEVFSSKVIEEVFLPVLGRTVLGMDGEEHRQWRGLYMPGFTRRLVTKWTEEIIRPVARHYTEEFIAAADGKRANLVDFGLRYPVRMIYEILGFPNDDEATYEEFARSGLTILLALGGVNPNDPEQTMRTIQRAAAESQSLYGAIHEIIATRRAEGAEGDDLIGHMLRSEFEGRQLTDDELTVFFRSLVPPASETTTRTWLNVMVCLLDATRRPRRGPREPRAGAGGDRRGSPSGAGHDRVRARHDEGRGGSWRHDPRRFGRDARRRVGQPRREHVREPGRVRPPADRAAVAHLRFRDAHVRRDEHGAKRDGRGDRTRCSTCCRTCASIPPRRSRRSAACMMRSPLRLPVVWD